VCREPVNVLNDASYLAAQAQRLAPVRSDLLRRAHIGWANRVLEIGCGTGEITQELKRRSPGLLVAIDRDPQMVGRTVARVDGIEGLCSVGEHLPFASAAFDCVVFAFVLLWASDPGRLVSEAARVVRPGGHVVALAEPDYGTYWEQPRLIGDLLLQGFRALRANPTIGADLCELFEQAGLQCRCGRAQGSARGIDSGESDDEVCMLLATLSAGTGPDTATVAMEGVTAARERGERRALVPICYATGMRPTAGPRRKSSAGT